MCSNLAAPSSKRYRARKLPAREDVTIQVLLATPDQTSRAWHEPTYIASSGGESVGSVTLRVQLREGGLPQ